MSDILKPKLRFKGFDGEWERRKFSEMFSERREKTTFEKEDELLSCAISGMYLNSELFGHFRGSSTIGYLKVKKNDLILSAQNLHLGNANVNLRFDHGIISPAYKVYDLIGCDPQFVHAWVKKDDTKDLFLSSTTEGASQCRKNIEWSVLESKQISVPLIKEQTHIGVLFSYIDKIIDKYQYKIERLLDIKNSMLQKLFPQNGEKSPILRFLGFTETWEQRNVYNLSSLNTKKFYVRDYLYSSKPLYEFSTSNINLKGMGIINSLIIGDLYEC